MNRDQQKNHEKHEHDYNHTKHDKQENHINHDHGNGGHSHHEHHKMMVEDFRFRFWWVFALTIPIMALSPMIQQCLGVDWHFAGDTWILAALSMVGISLAGGHF